MKNLKLNEIPENPLSAYFNIDNLNITEEKFDYSSSGTFIPDGENRAVLKIIDQVNNIPSSGSSKLTTGEIYYDLTKDNLYLALGPVDSNNDTNIIGLIPYVIDDEKEVLDDPLNNYVNTERPEHFTISLRLFRKVIKDLPEVYTSLPDSLPTAKANKYYVPSLSLFKELSDDTIKKSTNVITNLKGIIGNGKTGNDTDYVLSAAVGPDIALAIANSRGVNVVDGFTGSVKNPDGTFKQRLDSSDLETAEDYAFSADAGKKLHDYIFGENYIHNSTDTTLIERIEKLEADLKGITTTGDFENRLVTLENLDLASRVSNLEQIDIINGGKIGI